MNEQSPDEQPRFHLVFTKLEEELHVGTDDEDERVAKISIDELDEINQLRLAVEHITAPRYHYYTRT